MKVGKADSRAAITFVICPDRRILRTIENWISASGIYLMPHEPRMAGPWLHMVGFHSLQHSEFVRAMKPHVMRSLIESNIGTRYYVDTNQMFLYTYADLVEKHLDYRLRVINVLTDFSTFVEHLAQTGAFTPASHESRHELFWPTWPESLAPLDGSDMHSARELIKHHVADFQRRRALLSEAWLGRHAWVDIDGRGLEKKTFLRTLGNWAEHPFDPIVANQEDACGHSIFSAGRQEGI